MSPCPRRVTSSPSPGHTLALALSYSPSAAPAPSRDQVRRHEQRRAVGRAAATDALQRSTIAIDPLVPQANPHPHPHPRPHPRPHPQPQSHPHPHPLPQVWRCARQSRRRPIRSRHALTRSASSPSAPRARPSGSSTWPVPSATTRRSTRRPRTSSATPPRSTSRSWPSRTASGRRQGRASHRAIGVRARAEEEAAEELVVVVVKVRRRGRVGCACARAGTRRTDRRSTST